MTEMTLADAIAEVKRITKGRPISPSTIITGHLGLFQAEEIATILNAVASAAPDLARAYIAQAKQIESADKLAAAARECMKDLEYYVEYDYRDVLLITVILDTLIAALSAYEEARK